MSTPRPVSVATSGPLAVALVLVVLGCGGSSQAPASEGTTAVSQQCSGPPVVTQGEGGVFISYCGATTFAPAQQIFSNAPWARRAP